MTSKFDVFFMIVFFCEGMSSLFSSDRWSLGIAYLALSFSFISDMMAEKRKEKLSEKIAVMDEKKKKIYRITSYIKRLTPYLIALIFLIWFYFDRVPSGDEFAMSDMKSLLITTVIVISIYVGKKIKLKKTKGR